MGSPLVHHRSLGIGNVVIEGDDGIAGYQCIHESSSFDQAQHVQCVAFEIDVVKGMGWMTPSPSMMKVERATQ